MDILDDLKKLHDKFVELNADEVWLVSLREKEKEIKALMLVQNFGDNPAIKQLRDLLKEETSACNVLLTNDENLGEVQRGRLFERKRAYLKLLSFFSSDDQLKVLHEEIKDNLEEYG